MSKKLPTKNKASAFNTPAYKPKPIRNLTTEDVSDELIKILRHRRNSGSPGLRNFIAVLRQMIAGITKETIYNDTYGNLYVSMTDDPILWVAHLDTVHRSEADKTGLLQEIIAFRKPNKDELWLGLPVDTDSHCLGADDGVGISCLLHLMKHKPIGTFLFTLDEEIGLKGASAVTPQFLQRFKIAIEIDRKNESEVIYENIVGMCASKSFAQAVCDGLGMGHKPSNNGVSTDICQFAKYIPECVNIAAGYNSEHTSAEEVNLDYVIKLREALASLDIDKLLASVSRKANDFLTGTSRVQNTYGGYGGYLYKPTRSTMHNRFANIDTNMYNACLTLVTHFPEVAADLLSRKVSASDIMEGLDVSSI